MLEDGTTFTWDLDTAFKEIILFGKEQAVFKEFYDEIMINGGNKIIKNIRSNRFMLQYNWVESAVALELAI
jgi:hypothetical protein